MTCTIWIGRLCKNDSMVTVADLVAMPGLGLRPAEGAPALDGPVLRAVPDGPLELFLQC